MAASVKVVAHSNHSFFLLLLLEVKNMPSHSYVAATK